jgi:hypothetical protein
MVRDIDTEALGALHLDQLEQASSTAKITLPNGLVIDPRHPAWDSLINLAKWGVQTLKAKKPKFLETPEDLNLRPTVKKGRAGDGST